MSTLTAPAGDTDFALPAWSAAEFLDTPFVDRLTLRAVICRLGPGRWQWIIMNIGKGYGEIIAVGTEASVMEARQTAAAEIEKCVQDPLAEE